MQMARFVHAYARRTRLALLPPVRLVPLPLPLAETAPPTVALARLTRTVCEVGRLCIIYLVLHCIARSIYRHLLFGTPGVEVYYKKREKKAITVYDTTHTEIIHASE
jgi:hypothetical protein